MWEFLQSFGLWILIGLLLGLMLLLLLRGYRHGGHEDHDGGCGMGGKRDPEP